MAYPRYRAARAHKVFTRSTGDLTLNSTTWADLPTIGTTWDAVLAAQTGDVIECGVSAFWNAEAVVGHLDVATIVSAAAVNYFATAGGASGYGVPNWAGIANAQSNAGGPYLYTLVAADISSGTVTLRLRYRTSAASNKTLYAQSILPLQFYAKNLGPADPN